MRQEEVDSNVKSPFTRNKARAIPIPRRKEEFGEEFGGHPSMSKSLSSRKRFESGLLPAVYSASSLRTHQITGFAPAWFEMFVPLAVSAVPFSRFS